MTPVYVNGLGLWSPRSRDVVEWRAGGRQDEEELPACEVLPSRLRRATSRVIRMGAEVIGQAAAQGEVERSTVKLVFGSAYGEFQTAFDQMEMMAGDDGRLSPARFKNSVHNTVTGLLSMAFENRGFGTALAAGSATFAMSLLEGLTLIGQEGGEVIIAVADDDPVEAFRGGRQQFSPLGVAICLSAEPRGARLGTLSTLVRSEHRGTWLDVVPEAFRHNPAAAGLPLLAALLDGAGGRVPVELGTSTPYSIEVAPSAAQGS